MVTFQNKPDIKEKYLNRLKSHAEADELIQGTGWENGKGCAVGCTLENYNHAQYEKELGIPEWMARLYDKIFEGLRNGRAKKFAVEFLEVVPVGVDLDPLKWMFCAFILKENIERVLTLKISDDLKKKVVDSIRGVLAIHEVAIKSGNWDESAESAAAARSAESAAYERYATELLRLIREAAQ